MGKSLASTYPEAARVYEEADDILGFSISSLCFEGTVEELTKTENTQPALFVTCMAAFRILEARGVLASATAGHSVGEFSALVTAGAISFEDGLSIVRLRGELMARANETTPGVMAAIIGFDSDKISQICEAVSSKGWVQPSNLNAPTQIVISGEMDAVSAAMAAATDQGGRAVRLNVGAPFHSKLMDPVRRELEPALSRLSIADPAVPVVANATGDYVRTASEICRALLDQLASPVLWTASMQTLIRDGYRSFIEIGVGRVLTGLMRAIDRSVEVSLAATPDDIDKLTIEHK